MHPPKPMLSCQYASSLGAPALHKRRGWYSRLPFRQTGKLYSRVDKSMLLTLCYLYDKGTRSRTKPHLALNVYSSHTQTPCTLTCTCNLICSNSMNFDLVHVAAEQMICACAMHIKTGEGLGNNTHAHLEGVGLKP